MTGLFVLLVAVYLLPLMNSGVHKGNPPPKYPRPPPSPAPPKVQR